MRLALKALTFTFIVPGAVTYWIPRALDLWPDAIATRTGVAIAPALMVVATGLAIYTWCLWEFIARGRGIPAPVSHPTRLVVSGLYRHVRNPMYLGVLLVLLGETWLFRSTSFLIYTAVWLAFVHVNVLLYEEPNLRRKFGTAYDDYRAHVRRWLPGKRYGDGFMTG